MDLEQGFSDVPIGLSFNGDGFHFVHPEDNCATYVDLEAHIIGLDDGDWQIEAVSIELHGDSGLANRREQSQLTGQLLEDARSWLAEHKRDEIDDYVTEQLRNNVPSYDKYRHEIAA